MYLILCQSYLNHSLRFVGEKKRIKKKSHIKSQSQYFGKKSQLDYFPKSFSPSAQYCISVSAGGGMLSPTRYPHIVVAASPGSFLDSSACKHTNTHTHTHTHTHTRTPHTHRYTSHTHRHTSHTHRHTHTHTHTLISCVCCHP